MKMICNKASFCTEEKCIHKTLHDFVPNLCDYPVVCSGCGKMEVLCIGVKEEDKHE